MFQQSHFRVCIHKNEGRVLKRYLYKEIVIPHVHNSQKVEATHVCMDRYMDKQNVVYTYNGIVFCLKKEMLTHGT